MGELREVVFFSRNLRKCCSFRHWKLWEFQTRDAFHVMKNSNMILRKFSATNATTFFGISEKEDSPAWHTEIFRNFLICYFWLNGSVFENSTISGFWNFFLEISVPVVPVSKFRNIWWNGKCTGIFFYQIERVLCLFENNTAVYFLVVKSSKFAFDHVMF